MIPGLKAIPAFNGAGSTGGGSGGGTLSLTFVASSTSTSSSITIPGSAVAGDWAVLLSTSLDSSSVSAVTPSGWTAVANTAVGFSASNLRSMILHRVLTGTPGGTSVTGMNAFRDTKIMLIFRPSSSIISTVASTFNAEGTSGNPTSQTVSSSGVATPLVVLALGGGTGSVPSFTTETPAMTNVTKTDSTCGMRIGYTIYNSSPSDQSIDVGDVGDVTILQSGYVRFT